jgi:type II secretory ATPase GspE/PulE/Tfp pilus assembly ATPase PilB-like protein
MKTLLDDALDKVLMGTTSLSEVLRAVGQASAQQA